MTSWLTRSHRSSPKCTKQYLTSPSSQRLQSMCFATSESSKGTGCGWRGGEELAHHADETARAAKGGGFHAILLSGRAKTHAECAERRQPLSGAAVSRSIKRAKIL